jgi:hypothetical protein
MTNVWCSRELDLPVGAGLAGDWVFRIAVNLPKTIAGKAGSHGKAGPLFYNILCKKIYIYI